MIGVQGLSARRLAVLGEVTTGSYLGRAFQGAGYGTEMRAAVLAFAFDRLGATTARSEYVEGNPASGAVSARLGYRPDGTVPIAPRGERVVEHRMLLDRDAFVRPSREPLVGGWTTELAGLLGAPAPAG